MRAINIIKFLCGTWWGSNPTTLLILYKSYVRSILDYASFIYYPKLKKYREMLEKIQYAALRSAMGYRISTPTNIILAETKVCAIRDRARFLCRCYLSKIISFSESNVYENLMKTCSGNNKKKILKNRKHATETNYYRIV